jgi:hypothetical protein
LLPLLPLSQLSRNRVESLSPDSPLVNPAENSNLGGNLLSSSAECRTPLFMPDAAGKLQNIGSRAGIHARGQFVSIELRKFALRASNATAS